MNVEFHEIRFLIEGNFNAAIYPRAKTWADNYLALADENKKHWNYGNAIHHANIFLGRIALKASEVENAKNYLIKAGETPGSPQLGSFGPNMSLAKELLEIGETAVVLDYIGPCEKFWQPQLRAMFGANEWKIQIENGEIPDFKANLFY